MRALGVVLYIAIVLGSMGLGATGHADKLILALCIAASAALISGYVVLPSRQNAVGVPIPSIHQLSSEEAAEVRAASFFLGRQLPLGDARSVSFRLCTHRVRRLANGIAGGLMLAGVNYWMNATGHDVTNVFVAELSTAYCLISIVLPCIFGTRNAIC
jgi:hypothetical protein